MGACGCDPRASAPKYRDALRADGARATGRAVRFASTVGFDEFERVNIEEVPTPSVRGARRHIWRKCSTVVESKTASRSSNLLCA
jgi:hypothetical protein